MKAKRTVVIVVSVGAVSILIGMYLAGFRITYNPELITDWNAVSACAAWTSVLVSIAAVVASIVAIVYAIKVPQEIAARQDKVALFEKRFALCDCLERCISFSHGASIFNEFKEVESLFVSTFGNESIAALSDKEVKKRADQLLNQVENELAKGRFLFDFETAQWLLPIGMTLLMLLCEDAEEPNRDVSEEFAVYQKAVADAVENVILQIEEATKLCKAGDKK